jgi:hypothetical protein
MLAKKSAIPLVEGIVRGFTVVIVKGKPRRWECKSCDFHGGDYEECRLLGYTNAVLISQETHYVSATESSRLVLC